MRERKLLSQRAQEQGVRAEALCSGSVLAIATARSKQAEHIVLRCVAANRNSVKFGLIAERSWLNLTAFLSCRVTYEPKRGQDKFLRRHLGYSSNRTIKFSL